METIVNTNTKTIYGDSDFILDFIMKLHKSKLASDFTISEKLKLATEVDTRYNLGLAPGHTDKDKDIKKGSENLSDRFRKYGDYFIWRQTLEELIKVPANLIFITDETKVDWWKDENRKVPADILIEEFNEICGGKNFVMQSLAMFLEDKIDDQALNAEIHKLTYLVPKIRNYNNIKVLLNDEIQQKLLDHLHDSFYSDIYSLMSGETAAGGSIGSIEIEDVELDNFSLDDWFLEDSDYTFEVRATFNYKCNGNCTIDYSRDYASSRELDFKVVQSVYLTHVVDIRENIDECFYFEDFIRVKYEVCQIDVKDDERERLDFEREQYEKGAYNICPDCCVPLGIDNDGGNGFCIKCKRKH